MSGAWLPGSASRGLAGARRLRAAVPYAPAAFRRGSGGPLAQGCPAGASPGRAAVRSRSPIKLRCRLGQAAPAAPERKGRAQAATPELANEPLLCRFADAILRAGGVRDPRAKSDKHRDVAPPHAALPFRGGMPVNRLRPPPASARGPGACRRRGQGFEGAGWSSNLVARPGESATPQATWRAAGAGPALQVLGPGPELTLGSNAAVR